MSAKLAVSAVLAAAVTLTSVAAAEPEATNSGWRSRRRSCRAVRSVLTPLQAGALKRDSGTFVGDWSTTPDRTLIREGQKVQLYHAVWTFTGKRGTLVFRERSEWVDVGNDGNDDGVTRRRRLRHVEGRPRDRPVRRDRRRGADGP